MGVHRLRPVWALGAIEIPTEIDDRRAGLMEATSGLSRSTVRHPIALWVPDHADETIRRRVWY
jgi:hypothetical protein